MNVSEFGEVTVDAPWREVAEIYRGICWLRAAGYRRSAARRQANELAAAVSAARLSPAAHGDLAAQFEAVQITEETRVADAIAFAERIAPFSSGRLHAAAIVQS
jgi:hypothetical protein